MLKWFLPMRAEKNFSSRKPKSEERPGQVPYEMFRQARQRFWDRAAVAYEGYEPSLPPYRVVKLDGFYVIERRVVEKSADPFGGWAPSTYDGTVGDYWITSYDASDAQPQEYYKTLLHPQTGNPATFSTAEDAEAHLRAMLEPEVIEYDFPPLNRRGHAETTRIMGGHDAQEA